MKGRAVCDKTTTKQINSGFVGGSLDDLRLITTLVVPTEMGRA